ncbi:MAG: hypothetical protein KC417_12900, partial [Myxococcales bacterium]|nr:hypothetical protein [Myxococcales bacterium]
VPLAVFGAYNASITGAAWVPPRFGKNELSGALQGHSRGIFAAFTSTNILWNRFGHNFIYNVIMLAVWFGGPLGVSLAAFGVRVSRVTLCLGIGVALSLLVTFAHDDPGLHVVGPIHYSEASAFLVLLAVAGARRVYRWAKGSLGEDWGRRALLGGLVGTAIAAMLLVVHHGAALRRQAEIHESVYSFFETDPRFEHSVVIAPPYMTVWRAQPRFAWTGSFVFEWQRPFPGNRVIFAYDRPKAVELLARDFPDRRFYLVERGGGGWSVTDIGIGGSKAPAETPAN